MKKHTFLVFVLFICGCQQNKVAMQNKYHDDGRAKPIVAICPVIDSSESSFYWNLSEEFYSTLTSMIKNKGLLYLTPEDQLIAPGLQPINLFYEQNWKAKEKYPFDFVCLLEIIEHSFTPRDTSKKEKRVSEDLDITFRIKVVDLRKSTQPIVILQEIIHQRNYLPWQFNFINYEKVNYKKSGFNLTPLGFAHNKMSKTILKRIEEYILLAQVSHDH